jgi:transcriptional regulator with GAF, ATPase, and Fis domain
MNTLKIKYVALFVLIVIVTTYHVLLSQNLLPYSFFSGEDITVILLLLVAVFLLLLSGTVRRLSNYLISMRDRITMNISTDSIDALSLAENVQGTTGCKFLIGIQRYLNNIINLEELLNKFLVITVKITKSDRASIMLHDRKKDELYIYKTIGWGNREITLARKMKSKPGEGIAGRVFLDGEPLVVNKGADKEDFDAKEKYKSKSFVSYPIFSGEKIIGVLNLTEKGEESYTQSELEILSFVTNAVSLKLNNIELMNGRRV